MKVGNLKAVKWNGIYPILSLLQDATYCANKLDWLQFENHRLLNFRYFNPVFSQTLNFESKNISLLVNNTDILSSLFICFSGAHMMKLLIRGFREPFLGTVRFERFELRFFRPSSLLVQVLGVFKVSHYIAHES